MKRKAATFNFSFRTLTWMVFGMYACILIKMILFKRPPGYYLQHFLHNYDLKMIEANFRRANLIPFTTIMLFIKSKLSMRDIVGNVLGNIVGFIPFGILVPMLFPRLSRLFRTLMAAFLLSVAFEVLQLIFVLGSFDVDDLMLNTAGAAIGYYIYLADRRKHHRYYKASKHQPRSE
ncbi:MAG: VanZ family protein [Chitinophagaceae bacterium]|nr:MAG: VanZ family protein [Chitinophagaceae bacterium]